MKTTIVNLKGDTQGELEILQDFFFQEVKDYILKMVIKWQLSKRRTANPTTKDVSEVSGTTRKPFKQKGNGRARQGSLRSVQFRGGATIFGADGRKHDYKLNKKIKKQALIQALSQKMQEGKILILNDEVKGPSTKVMKTFCDNIKTTSMLIVSENKNLILSTRNIYKCDVLPVMGLNVYDIVRKEYLILEKGSIEKIEKRIGGIK